MSNLPPPSPGGPPNQPNPPPVAFAPPPPPAAAPASAPGTRTRLSPLLIAGAVVIVLALVVGGIALFRGSDGGAGNISGTKAGGAVEDAANAARVPRDSGGVELKACPFGGLDDLADAVPDGFDAGTAASAGSVAAVTQTSRRTDPQMLQCGLGNDTLRYGVVAAARPPKDIEDFLDRSLTEATGTFEDTQTFRGGTLLAFCTTPDAGSGRQVLCATTWYDSEVLVGLFASGDGASTDITTPWLKAELTNLVEDLEGADPTVTVIATEGPSGRTVTTDGGATANTTGDTDTTDTDTTDTLG